MGRFGFGLSGLEGRRRFIYREIQMISLTCITMAAVLWDLQSGRIPHAVIVTGLAMGLTYQLCTKGALGIILFLGGVVLPVLLLGVLFYFRMMGAGDIKLLCVAGGFLGPVGVFACLVRAVFVAAVFSVVLLCRRHMLTKRVSCFWDYVMECSQSGHWKPYMKGVADDAKFCFSVPILMGILCYILVF